MLFIYWAGAIILLVIAWRLFVRGNVIRWWYKFLAFIDPSLPVFSGKNFWTGRNEPGGEDDIIG